MVMGLREELVRGYIRFRGVLIEVMQRFVGCKERDNTLEIAINPCNFHFQQSTIYI